LAGVVTQEDSNLIFKRLITQPTRNQGMGIFSDQEESKTNHRYAEIGRIGVSRLGTAGYRTGGNTSLSTHGPKCH
jgi:hypothetical protein